LGPRRGWRRRLRHRLPDVPAVAVVGVLRLRWRAVLRPVGGVRLPRARLVVFKGLAGRRPLLWKAVIIILRRLGCRVAVKGLRLRSGLRPREDLCVRRRMCGIRRGPRPRRALEARTQRLEQRGRHLLDRALARTPGQRALSLHQELAKVALIPVREAAPLPVRRPVSRRVPAPVSTPSPLNQRKPDSPVVVDPEEAVLLVRAGVRLISCYSNLRLVITWRSQSRGRHRRWMRHGDSRARRR